MKPANGKRSGVWMGAAALLLLAGLLPGAAAIAQTPPAASAMTIGGFWPLNAPPRRWELIPRNQAASPHPHVTMTVENRTTEPGQFVMWFSNKRGQEPGDRDGELYRLCQLPGRSWLYFEKYLKSSPGRPLIEHQVASDRILLTRADGSVTDMIEDGEYQACGATGQPYLLGSGPWNYRIQIWGHLTENPRFKWFWDARVRGPVPIVDDCMTPALRRPAVMVQEAYWRNAQHPQFGDWNGQGAGEVDPRTGVPTGHQIRYNRTSWHVAGQLPYFLIGPPTPNPVPNRCANHVSQVAGG